MTNTEPTPTPDAADTRWFVVDATTWDCLHERLARPAEVKPRLAAFLAESREAEA